MTRHFLIQAFLILTVLIGFPLVAQARQVDVNSTGGVLPGPSSLDTELLEGFGSNGSGEGTSHGRGFDRLLEQWAYVTDWELLISVIIGLLVAALCAAMIAWQPGNSAGRGDPTQHEERKALIALGVLGAMVANIVEVSPPMALVIFGIGGLIRFRTVFERPKVTARAIGVVVIGLACGLNLLAMAIILAIFFWVLLRIMESKATVQVKVYIDESRDCNEVIQTSRNCLDQLGLRVYSTTSNRPGTEITVKALLDTSVTPDELARKIKGSLSSGPPVVIHWTME